ncbi:MAG: hypothetical protein RLZZ65_1709 [Bacteroidota bacterium]|jgi:putative transcriptional regulator
MKITEQHLFKSKYTPKTGRLLIAEPFLNEVYFQRAVILLIHHDQNESMGLVLNHPSETLINEALEDCDFALRIYHGGPVDAQRLFYIHQFENIKDAKKITPNLYFGGDWDELMHALQHQKHPEKMVRFFSGYSGWGAEQLKDEMSEHAWICVSQFDDTQILQLPSDHLWQKCLLQQGPTLAPFALFPLNVNDN